MIDAVEGLMKPFSNPAKQGRAPHVLIEVGSNEAAGSLMPSIAAACPIKQTLSSSGE